MGFSLDEIDRYERQILVPEWGAAGQERLRAARVEIRGAGPAAEVALRYLAAAGVGTIAVATEALAGLARELNPHVAVELRPHPLREDLVGAAVLVAGDGAEPTSEIALGGAGARHAAGAALAVEAMKALLGLPFQRALALPEAG